MLVAEKKISVKDFLQMNFEGEDAYYELIDGEIVRKSSPNLQHQETSQNINFEMLKFVRSKDLGKVFTAPTDVYLDEFTHLIPDLFFVSKKNKKILDYDVEGLVRGVPELVVEILSPSSMLKDRFDKMNVYQKVGVKEYWIVDPNNNSIEVYENKKGRYEPYSFAAEEGKVKSKILKGLELDLKDIFPK